MTTSSVVRLAQWRREAGGWQPGPHYTHHETLSAQGAPRGLGRLTCTSWLAAGADSPTTVLCWAETLPRELHEHRQIPLSHSADTVFSKKLQVCGTRVEQISWHHFPNSMCSLCVTLVNFTIFQTFLLLSYLLWWSVILLLLSKY